MYRSLGQHEKAIDYYSQALAILEEIKFPFADLVQENIDKLKGESHAII